MDGPNAKARLLEESLRLRGDEGLGALSFREIARRAGVSHQLPYHYFTNREGVLAAIATDGFARLDRELLSAMAKDGEGEARLRGVLRAYMGFAIENSVHYAVMFRPELVVLERHPEALRLAMRTFSRLVDAIALRHPAAPADDPRIVRMADTLWASAHGVATLWLDGPLQAKSPDLRASAFIAQSAAMFCQAAAKLPDL